MININLQILTGKKNCILLQIQILWEKSVIKICD